MDQASENVAASDITRLDYSALIATPDHRFSSTSGEIAHDFTDPLWDTRFLDDLYQDLSEHAKKIYALLQTPEFVEEF